MADWNFLLAWTGDLSHEEVCNYIGIEVERSTHSTMPRERLGRVHISDRSWLHPGSPAGIEKWSGVLNFQTYDYDWTEAIVAIMTRVTLHYISWENREYHFFIRDELEMLECTQDRTRVSDRMLRLMPKSIIEDWPHHIEVGILSKWMHASD
jgi:hypothetical protein